MALPDLPPELQQALAMRLAQGGPASRMSTSEAVAPGAAEFPPFEELPPALQEALAMRFSQGMSASKVTTSELSALEYDITDSAARVRFLQDREGGGQRICVAEMKVNFVDISFYAKQHLQKQPTLLECGIVICGPMVQTFLIPTGRSRMAGNGSVAVKYYDASKPIHEEDIEKYERVGIRLPSGVFTYAFFESQP
ncbi:unnamed protein product, partial [Polarella glacialis]